MKTSNQNLPVDATTPAISERVSVAMAEIAENVQEGLLALALALAVGAGLHVMEADVTALAGPRGTHDATRTAVRHGRERGYRAAVPSCWLPRAVCFTAVDDVTA